mgnify:CR=1 FL=1
MEHDALSVGLSIILVVGLIIVIIAAMRDYYNTRAHKALLMHKRGRTCLNCRYFKPSRQRIMLNGEKSTLHLSDECSCHKIVYYEPDYTLGVKTTNRECEYVYATVKCRWKKAGNQGKDI